MNSKMSRPLSPAGLKTYSLKSRKSKVDIRSFGRCAPSSPAFRGLVNSLPDILAGRDFKELLDRWQRARRKGRGVIFGLGAHVIKVGLNPVLIDLMKRGWITSLAMNGAGIIHDFEVAFCGRTSEEVADQLRGGHFGMARETGELLSRAITEAAEQDIGLGAAVGRMIASSRWPYRSLSLLGTAHRLGLPVTVHVAIGTDIIHFHPSMSGRDLGQASLTDFFRLCSELRRLNGGGLFINCGSAVVLPEVFLKAVTFVRNHGFPLEGLVTAVFDFCHHYRPWQNVVLRPVGERGKGFYFVGHHELMIPLLAAGLKSLPSGKA
ncbi:MAG: hypothetical protein A2Y56_03985 [Candidatus Aminicenantes bacterium RBG_13_63_10]|nr:MAG: hypothetical protein A2Y56_03985 [Candidatus Aminicenantes bacterium RBG_13_63_10]